MGRGPLILQGKLIGSYNRGPWILEPKYSYPISFSFSKINIF